MRLLILLALVCVGAVFGDESPKRRNRIVGGEDTDIETYPFMSNMKRLFLGVFFQSCGGTLITRNVVVSAAHCFNEDTPEVYRVTLGTTFRTTGGVDHSVSSIINHQQYTSASIDCDVSLIRLHQPAVLSNTIATASIAGLQYRLPENSVVTAIGWGTLRAGGSQPLILQHVDVDVINHDICTERYLYLKSQPGFSSWPDITKNMLCAGILDQGGKDACQGDSGGPLVHNGNILVGVTSWGRGCADEFYPGVYADVSSLSTWIVHNTLY